MTVWMHSHLQLVIMKMQLLKGGLKETYGLCGMSPENIASITGKDLDKSMQYWKEKFRCYYKVITVNKIRRRK